MSDITQYKIEIKFTESGAEKVKNDVDKVKKSVDGLSASNIKNRARKCNI